MRGQWVTSGRLLKARDLITVYKISRYGKWFLGLILLLPIVFALSTTYNFNQQDEPYTTRWFASTPILHVDSVISVYFIIDGSASMQDHVQSIEHLVSRLKGRLEGQTYRFGNVSLEYSYHIAYPYKLESLDAETNLNDINLYTGNMSPIAWMIDTLGDLLYQWIPRRWKKEVGRIAILVTDFQQVGEGLDRFAETARKIQKILFKSNKEIRTLVVLYPPSSEEHSGLCLFVIGNKDISMKLFPPTELNSIFEFYDISDLSKPNIRDFYVLTDVRWALNPSTNVDPNVRVCKWNAHLYTLKDRPDHYSLEFMIEVFGFWKKFFKVFDSQKEKVTNELRVNEPYLESIEYIYIEDNPTPWKVGIESSRSRKKQVYINPTVRIGVVSNMKIFNKKFKLYMPRSVFNTNTCAELYSDLEISKAELLLSKYLCEIYLRATFSQNNPLTLQAKLVRACP